jgi:hypothetical protein
MHIRIHPAALAAFAVLLPVGSEAQVSSMAQRTGRESAPVLVSELLAHRQELSLTAEQVDSLTTLSERIRHDRGHLQIVALDRVPGKSVPRFARVYPLRREARGMALRLLTPDQRVAADKLLRGSPPAKTAAR